MKCVVLTMASFNKLSTLILTNLIVLLCSVEGFQMDIEINSAHIDAWVNPSEPKSEHSCRYRYHLPYPEYHFQLLTGWSCYNYAHKKWMKDRIIYKSHEGILHNLTEFKIPFLIINSTRVFFDYNDSKYVNTIKDLHVHEKYYNKWFSCARSAMECCRNMNPIDVNPDHNYPCPALWDGYTCYTKTKHDTRVRRQCPLYLTSSEKFVCNLESEKECNYDGWNHQTDYSLCSSSFRYRKRHMYHIIILSIVTILMIPSIIIFFSYDKLKIIRVVLHRNLIMAIFIKNVLVLISKNVIIMDAINVQQEDSVMEIDDTWCRVLIFFENLSKNLIFSCMTADAYYAHKTIARAFQTDFNVHLIHGLTAVCSSIPTIIWSILMSINNVGKCWASDLFGYQWVTDGYKYACLVINFILFLDIVRVLFLKYRKSPAGNTSRAVHATFIMLCLFGIPLLISSQRNMINMDDCIASDIYVYITYTIEGAQGVFMVLFFCYLNHEVIYEVGKSWSRFKRNYLKRRQGFRDASRRKTLLSVINNTQVSTKV